MARHRRGDPLGKAREEIRLTENSSGSIVTGETGLAHTRTGVPVSSLRLKIMLYVASGGIVDGCVGDGRDSAQTSPRVMRLRMR